ncbi:bile acid:sodium symporter family protein [Pollutibacter soli]|uniref:bile acid:sodium symporter family protein n=1 Tax=Pollutibacter soli TaxID=3034157 RepID=UPI003013AB70
MSKNRLFLSVTVFLLISMIIAGLSGRFADSGLLIIGFFISLALFFSTRDSLRSYIYTISIFASVSAAMFYPGLFVRWGNFNVALLITPLIQLIMFGMGTSMSLGDFGGVIKNPKGVLVGVVSHFIIMPLLGFLLAKSSGLEAEIAAGIILLGCSPNGMASNVISYLAKANLALSVTITAVSTMLAPFLTPLLMKWLANSFIEINMLHMMWDISKMVILPIAAGLLFNHFLRGKVRWLDKAMPLVSMAGVAFSIVVIVAAGRDSLLTIGPLLLGLLVIHNLAGYFLGYSFARFFRMSERDCRTVAIEVGMQNAGLATGIAKEMGKLATTGLAPAIFGSLMNITGSVLASWWHKREPLENPEVPILQPEEKNLQQSTLLTANTKNTSDV